MEDSGTIRVISLNLSVFELGVLWGLIMREDLQNNIPESLRNKIHRLIDMEYEESIGKAQSQNTH